jgi:UDP-N-acetylmuramoyl-tripeptide--D-alanyl-D-alanine ligase
MTLSDIHFSLHAALTGLGLLVAFGISWPRMVRALHMLQLDSYSNWRLVRWLALKPLERLFEPKTASLLLLLWLLTLTSWRIALEPASLITMWVCGGSVIFYFLHRHKPAEKKPLVYTGRAKRIFGVALAAHALACLWMGLDWFLTRDYTSLFMQQLVFLQLCPLSVVLANALLWPVQRAINQQFLNAAQKKLADWQPRVIGVAGSFGKTSTKYFLDTILSTKYPSLKTPGSFNTPMGICRVINEQLTQRHKVFIVEMGTYRKGDVSEIARFVKPSVGIISSIGPEHMERFKTLDNVKAANYELIECLPQKGIAVINLDSPESRELYQKAIAANRWKVVGFSLDKMPDSNLWAEDIACNKEGTSFTLVSATGERVGAKSRLLGRHAVSNIVGAATIALELGLSLKEIAAAIPRLEPAEHRLQLLHNNANGVTIIDDAYNSNPEGAREALNVLAQFTGGSRILITPGMVELGHLHETENEAFGARAAKVCDYVILVGPKQTAPIARGLAGANFPADKTFVVKNLTEATGQLGKILKPGDTVLFENDLPDQYAES